MTYYPIRNDRRYTLRQEYTGHISAKPQWVARFCGEWIGSSSFRASAAMLAVGHDAVRRGAPIVQAREA